MKKYFVAGLLVAGLATPAWAATESKWFVTVDTVGNCSVSHGPPSAGQTAMLETGGYESVDLAKKALDEIRNSDKCKGVVE
ncbi:MAG: hypothetical protein ACRECX_14500 [Methyloceanibacter sp.]|uniref:hypothetical protein n=1 Tax=Methyloceanibacter sp. TaxID=1965321 RepID=UPI003D6CE35C